ncbi:MAG: hypothetical protein K6G80_02235 [Treponema sp.]|nr:hypothetical protein [Treponema sp.]
MKKIALIGAALLACTGGMSFSETAGLKQDMEQTVSTVNELLKKAGSFDGHMKEMQNAFDGLLLDGQVKGVKVSNVTEDEITISWAKLKGKNAVGLTGYRIYWSDKNLPTSKFALLAEVGADVNSYTWKHMSLRNYFFKVSAVFERETQLSAPAKSAVKAQQAIALEKLDRGLVAFNTKSGVFLSWRLFADEVTGYGDTGLTGVTFDVYRGKEKIATVTDSTNYLDKGAKAGETYAVVALGGAYKGQRAEAVAGKGANFIDIPVQKPPVAELPKDMVIQWSLNYDYVPEDTTIGDVDGDGEYEYIVRWEPTNGRDVSQRGYTGKVFFDCYKLDGTLLWRIDMGTNLRAGSHYNCFAAADVNQDGKAEFAVLTAPGTKYTIYNKDGSVKTEKYITIPEDDRARGVTDESNYCFSAPQYKAYMVEEVMHWGDWENEFWKLNSSEETFANATKARSKWDKNIENLWDYMYVERKQKAPAQLVGHDGPYTKAEAEKLVDHFYKVVAMHKEANRNILDEYEGFIVSGPQYITVFAGDGNELDTKHARYPREDDGLIWGDFQWVRIEPANRSERHNAGAAYLDGKKPYFVFGNGYYTRSTIATYTLDENNKIQNYWGIDSGFVEMTNPFFWMPGTSDTGLGNIPENAYFAGQGDHSISFADVDGDGCQEIIYGGAIVDNDGTLYSSAQAARPGDGEVVRFGHGDAQHVTDIDPDYPGLEIFACYEGGRSVPYGTAMRASYDKATNVLFGDFSGKDTGRCMVGDLYPQYRGLETWGFCNRQANGKVFEGATIGTNQNIRWASDMTTSIYTTDIVGVKKDGSAYTQLAAGADGTASNNGTKGCAGLIADVFGDWREELIVRKADASAIRIYTNTDVTNHKLYTLTHNPQYRAQVSAQQSAYNQPSYPDFYLASDTDWEYVWVPNVDQSKLKDSRKNKSKPAKAKPLALPDFPTQAQNAGLAEDAAVKALRTANTALDFKSQALGTTLDAAAIAYVKNICTAIDALEGKCFADTAAVKQFFADVHAVPSTQYSTESVNELAVAMKSTASDIQFLEEAPAKLAALKKSLEQRIASVSKLPEFYTLYLDFAMRGGVQPDGYITLYGDDPANVYSAGKKYGFERPAAGRNRGDGDPVYMNFVMDNTLYVEVPAAGTYSMALIYGDAVAANTTRGTVLFNDKEVGTFGGQTPLGEFGQSAVMFTADAAGTIKVKFGGRLNALRIEQIVPVE